MSCKEVRTALKHFQVKIHIQTALELYNSKMGFCSFDMHIDIYARINESYTAHKLIAKHFAVCFDRCIRSIDNQAVS